MTHPKCLRGGGVTMAGGRLRWFLINNPPLVIFSLCVMLFVFILATMALYVTYNDKITYIDDVSQDWNVFLTSLSKLELCIVPENASTSFLHQELMRHRPSWWPSLEEDPLEDNQRGMKSYSIPMSSIVRPSSDFYSASRSVTYLTASLAGKHMGYKGTAAAQKLTLLLSVAHPRNVSGCTDNTQKNCDAFEAKLCIKFRGPREMFPRESGPGSCHRPRLNGSEVWEKMNWQFRDVDSLNFCRSRTMIDVRYEPDPKLSKRLQQHHRMLSRSHLLYTCVFLVMCLAFILSCALCGAQPASSASL